MMHQFDSLWYGVPWFFAFLAPLFFILVPLSFLLKGYALWHAAKRGDAMWFIALFLINTLGILELIYILRFLKHSPRDVVHHLRGKHSHHSSQSDAS